MRRDGPHYAAAFALFALSAGTAGAGAADSARLRFAVRYPQSLAEGPLDGRLLLLLSSDPAAEPRFQVNAIDVPKSQQVFGIDVVSLEARRAGRDGRQCPRLSGRGPG